MVSFLLSMGYEKDIFAVFEYEFELLHNRSFLVKSFAYAHGEIQNKFWMKYFSLEKYEIKFAFEIICDSIFHTL